MSPSRCLALWAVLAGCGQTAVAASTPTVWDRDMAVAVDAHRQAVNGKEPPMDAGAGDRVLTLENSHVTWRLAVDNARLRTVAFGHRASAALSNVSDSRELALVFSGEAGRVAEPRHRVTDLSVTGIEPKGKAEVAVRLRSESPALEVVLHLQLDGSVRRKWAGITNRSGKELLLLDVELDDLATECATSGGGAGFPVMLDGRGFAAIEHPAGDNACDGGRVRLAHHPGVRIAPGATYRTRTALVRLASSGSARDLFVDYIAAHARRTKRLTSIYTPFGINNQWGACPTLTDEEILNVLGVLARWKSKGVRPDYFTLDTGWSDPASDLTKFRPVAFPSGPGEVTARIRSLGMAFGLWFPLGWGTQSCWDYEPAYADGHPPGLPYREGYPLTAGGITFCLGDDRYHRILKGAVMHHVRQNGVRFLKFDGGLATCDDPSHGHLPGQYGLEAMYDRLIGMAEAARAEAPDLFVMWYWGLRSPFWALHGDTIFESGLHMEGSGTSSTPSLYYRDSVTLAQDQNAQAAGLIPPVCKDSLGVWLADKRWGNFMGKERWREALVMDLGRGNLLFPNLWGDLYLLDDDDVRFLASMTALAKRNEALLRTRRIGIGDAWADGPYGYAYGKGNKALVFLNNPSFEARPVRLELGPGVGLGARAGAPLRVVGRFPEVVDLVDSVDGVDRAGEALVVWLRPFETLLIEVGPSVGGASALPRRAVDAQAVRLGRRLELRTAPHEPRLEMRFADAGRFEVQGLRLQRTSYTTTLPDLTGPQPIMAIPVRLRRGEAEWRYSPKPVEIVQVTARVDGRNVILAPVPDGRQHGNTQHAGCSWVLYKTRLPREWAGKTLQISVHAYVPAGVEARIEAWVIGRWWREDTRPTPDGYYTDAPS